MRLERCSAAYVAPEGAPFDEVLDALAELGLDVERVQSVDRVVDLVEDRAVDCLVVDAAEGIDARAVLAEATTADPLLPVVVYPLDGSEGLAAHALDLGVDAYVCREEGIDALRAAIESVLADLDDPAERDPKGMLDTLLEMIPKSVEIYFKDTRGRHVHVCEGFPEMIDPPYMQTPDDTVIHTSEGMLGMTDFDLYGPEVGERSAEDEQRIMETGEAVVDQLEETVAPDGQYVAVSTTKAPWYDSAGRLRGIVGVTLDETDRERQRRAVERENERLDRFASVLSHDLRNPLSVAQARAAELDGDGEVLSDLEWALDRIDELISDVLELTRQGAVVDDPEPLELSEPVEDAWATVDGDATLERVDAPLVTGDPERLRTLFENLFRNAVEHAGPDVTVRVVQRDRGFAVTDDGPGVPADIRDQVFEHGFSSEDRGTGLGLAIVEEIVDAHGWSIHVEESEAGGAAFVVELDSEA